eukprot:276580-Pleurochrysis_carterae.AAC.1
MKRAADQQYFPTAAERKVQVDPRPLNPSHTRPRAPHCRPCASRHARLAPAGVAKHLTRRAALPCASRLATNASAMVLQSECDDEKAELKARSRRRDAPRTGRLATFLDPPFAPRKHTHTRSASLPVVRGELLSAHAPSSLPLQAMRRRDESRAYRSAEEDEEARCAHRSPCSPSHIRTHARTHART